MNYKNIDYIRTKEIEAKNFVEMENAKKYEVEEEFPPEVHVSRTGVVSSAVIIAFVLNVGILIAVLILARK